MDRAGAYTADRAAALSGVPKSTVHYWARKGHLVPSISSERVKLWSYTDLLALRTIYWLRQPKRTTDGHEIPSSTMPAVRRSLEALRDLDLELFENGRPLVVIDRSGQVLLDPPGLALQTPTGQTVSRDLLDVVAPFKTEEGLRGPDLQSPRRHLRILPLKLAGSPHVEGTRIETRALAALATRGYPADRIGLLYPAVTSEAIEEALDLEQQLASNLRRAA
ncbi:MAG TPA: MerR family transcriptional regulator [Thermoanaerobaculia bacterium]|nr:MerR family transcriptional regulator [Thermoanaerobaculia bacterium]